MGRSHWLHKETRTVLNCIDLRAREGSWSTGARCGLADEIRKSLLEKHGTRKEPKDILQKIKTLEQTWTAPRRKLLQHGSKALKKGYLEKLEANPNGRYINQKHTTETPTHYLGTPRVGRLRKHDEYVSNKLKHSRMNVDKFLTVTEGLLLWQFPHRPVSLHPPSDPAF